MREIYHERIHLSRDYKKNRNAARLRILSEPFQENIKRIART